MANFPDGWVFVVDPEKAEVVIQRKNLVMCKSCWKRGLDNCPMEFYWENHPIDDNCFCAMGERRENNA